jgi:hypothetical protein
MCWPSSSYLERSEIAIPYASNRPQRHCSEDHHGASIHWWPCRLVFGAYARNISNDRRQRKVENFTARGRCLDRLSPNSNSRGSFPVPWPSRLASRDRNDVLLDNNPLCIKAPESGKCWLNICNGRRYSSVKNLVTSFKNTDGPQSKGVVDLYQCVIADPTNSGVSLAANTCDSGTSSPTVPSIGIV